MLWFDWWLGDALGAVVVAPAFTTPGTYPYVCGIHPFMHGTVVVTK